MTPEGRLTSRCYYGHLGHRAPDDLWEPPTPSPGAEKLASLSPAPCPALLEGCPTFKDGVGPSPLAESPDSHRGEALVSSGMVGAGSLWLPRDRDWGLSLCCVTGAPRVHTCLTLLLEEERRELAACSRSCNSYSGLSGCRA